MPVYFSLATQDSLYPRCRGSFRASPLTRSCRMRLRYLRGALFFGRGDGREDLPGRHGDRGPWISARLLYYSEDIARVISAPYPHDALVTVSGDLLRIVRGSSMPAVTVWIHEGLESVAQELWEGDQES
jgi:hypothetical protein